MFRAVFDANVLASAFIRARGPSGQILREFLENRRFELVLSTPILQELRQVLFYPRLRKELDCSDHEIEIRVAAIGVLADLADGDLDVKAMKDDPDDDKYLIAALLGRVCGQRRPPSSRPRRVSGSPNRKAPAVPRDPERPASRRRFMSRPPSPRLRGKELVKVD